MNNIHPVILKAPCFRIGWVDETGKPDGFTYAIEKSRLLQEVSRRRRQCNDTPVGTVKVILVPVESTKWIESRPGRVVNTDQNLVV